MSGIYIPNMEMPDKCIKCKLMRRCGKDDLDYVCMPARVYVEDLTNAYKPRPEYCPLVPVPPHGRLIDADALIGLLGIMGDKCDNPVVWAQMRYIVEDVPTIIRADKDKENNNG